MRCKKFAEKKRKNCASFLAQDSCAIFLARKIAKFFLSKKVANCAHTISKCEINNLINKNIMYFHLKNNVA